MAQITEPRDTSIEGGVLRWGVTRTLQSWRGQAKAVPAVLLATAPALALAALAAVAGLGTGWLLIYAIIAICLVVEVGSQFRRYSFNYEAFVERVERNMTRRQATTNLRLTVAILAAAGASWFVVLATVLTAGLMALGGVVYSPAAVVALVAGPTLFMVVERWNATHLDRSMSAFGVTLAARLLDTISVSSPGERDELRAAEESVTALVPAFLGAEIEV